MNIGDILNTARSNNTQRAEQENTLKLPLSTPVRKTFYVGEQNIEQESIGCERSAMELFQKQAKPIVKDFEIVGDGLNYRGSKVFNFYMNILRVALVQSEDIAGNCDGCLMTVEVVVFHGGQQERQRLNNVSKDFLSNQKFLDRVPLAVSFGLSKNGLTEMLYKYVNFLLSEYTGEPVIVFRSTGWKQVDSRKVYVDGEKALGYSEIKAHAMSGLKIRKCLESMNLYQCFCDMCLTIRNMALMRMLLLYILSSYIFTLFFEVNMPLKHCLGLIGPRATRKTSLAMCFSQIENKRTPKFNFLATESGIQAHFQDYHDSCILIDDLAPSPLSAKRRESERKLEMLLRLFGDAGERVINKNFLDEKAQKLDYTVKGGAIITGEYFYSSSIAESSIARAIILELDHDDVDLERLSFYQKNPQHLETFIFHFLVFIGENWQKNKNLVISVIERYRQKYQGYFSNARYAEYMGQHMATAYLLAELFKYNGEITMEEEAYFHERTEKDLEQILLQNDEKMKTRAPIITVLLSINYMIDTRKFIEWGQDIPLEESCVIVSNDAVYLRQRDLPDIVKDYCLKTGEVYTPMGCKELGQLLVQEGLCSAFHEGGRVRLSKKYSKDYGNTRLMEIPLDKMKDRLGILGDE